MKFNTTLSLMRAFIVQADDRDEALELVKDNILTTTDDDVNIVLVSSWDIEVNDFAQHLVQPNQFYINVNLELNVMIEADNEEDAQEIIDDQDWIVNHNPQMITLDEEFEGFWLEQNELKADCCSGL